MDTKVVPLATLWRRSHPPSASLIVSQMVLASQ